jgi:hypothetical protein
MSNIIGLPGVVAPTHGPKEVVIDILRKMLEDAESGMLQSFYAVGFLADGTRMTGIANTHPSVYEVVGGIEMLKMEYIHNHTNFDS